MPFKATAQFDNLDYVLDRLNRLSDVVRGPAVESAVRAAAEVVAEQARSLAPRRTGLLARSIGVTVSLYGKHGSIVVTIGPRSGFREQFGVSRKGRPKYANPLYYAHLVEGGTRPHGYRTRGGTHPGARPYPFMGPAMAQSEGRMIGAIQTAVICAVVKAMGG